MTVTEDVETGAPPPPLVQGAAGHGVAGHGAAGQNVLRFAGADFSRREFALRERMDAPCTYADYRRAALDLAWVNRLTHAHTPALEFLASVLRRTRVGYEPLHVVDVGCGHGDLLREVHRWASRRSVPLRLTGVDRTPYAARLARECDRHEHVSAGTITWVTADAFAAPLPRPVDVVLSSLFAHQLAEDAIAEFLRWSEAEARAGWWLGDVRRSARAARVFALGARALRLDDMAAHDGVVSFRRALSVEEWRALVPVGAVKSVGWGRVAVERLKV